MTRDEIIELAREADAGFHPGEKGPLSESICGLDQIIRFATLVAAAEREACAKVCDAEGREWDSDDVVTEKNHFFHKKLA